MPNKYDKQKQITSLMPNLIHSLDASSLILLYEHFSSLNNNPQFFSVHDCFATTGDKASLLKVLLASVYTSIYTDKPYLYKFDKYIFDYIENNSNYKLDRDKRTINIDGVVHHFHDID